MLLRGLTVLILFQLLGTGLNALCLPLLPGPILGMILLFLYLLCCRRVSESINRVATSLLHYLPLLLIPPAVGVILHTQELIEHFWALAAALTLSILFSFVFAGWLMQKLIDRQSLREKTQ